MALVRFRLHTIRLVTAGTGSYAENGDYIPAADTLSDPIPCRYEPNGRARTIPFGDDKGYVYDYTIYLNTDCPDIAYDQPLKLYDKDGVCIGDYRCKGFHRGQLDAKLWV